jgi:hypothetical protein
MADDTAADVVLLASEPEDVIRLPFARVFTLGVQAVVQAVVHELTWG